jgi:hypothetical protein
VVTGTHYTWNDNKTTIMKNMEKRGFMSSIHSNLGITRGPAGECGTLAKANCTEELFQIHHNL